MIIFKSLNKKDEIYRYSHSARNLILTASSSKLQNLLNQLFTVRIRESVGYCMHIKIDQLLETVCHQSRLSFIGNK